MIESLLIANRGEIARRIQRTAKRLGIRTIAVYSDADAKLAYVREADEAVRIGPAPASESYLVHAKILDAARATKAQAIHPGYGFLSENADFADAVKEHGFVWVGPPASAIKAMGLKDSAKTLMSAAGVPVTPGYWGKDQAADHLAREAEVIGYPVLIKAVAGGGGKGMRRVERPEDFLASLASCQREAASSFGDDRVLIEKYITGPRHIEVQVFGDSHGNVVHLFERDCSLQRRHQKVIEEAPAPGMDAVTRDAICAAAVRAAKAVSYEGAGTVEFIADGSQGLRPDRFWFMEMNTRLQVEHPVTEMVTGQDLVEWQLRVASGEALPLTQDQISLQGHAIEARLYAENTSAGFLPSTGVLTRFKQPGGIRIDTAVQEGDEISAFYDPMIAKLISFGTTRAVAAAQLNSACRALEVWPVKTNAGFLARLLSHTDFKAAAIDTSFIPQHFEALQAPKHPSRAVLNTAAKALIAEQLGQNRAPLSPWSQCVGFRMNATAPGDVRLQYQDQVYSVPVTDAQEAAGLGHGCVDGHILVFENGDVYDFTAPRAKISDDASARASGAVAAPMPGHIIAVFAKVGDVVAKGQPLVVMEAMKMEHVLTAPFAGVLADLKAMVGDKVSENTVLVRLDRQE